MKKLQNPIIEEINVIDIDGINKYYVEYTDGFIIYNHRFNHLEIRKWVIDNYDIISGQVQIEIAPSSIEQAENPIYFKQDIDEFIDENYEEIIIEMLKQPVLACQSNFANAMYNICKPR